MIRFKTAERVSLDTPPIDWEMYCINCDISSKGYVDVNANFKATLWAGIITHDLYCKKCREYFLSFVKPRNNFSKSVPHEEWTHRCGYCGEITVGKKHIDEYVAKHYEKKYQNRCKECDRETAPDRRI